VKKPNSPKKPLPSKFVSAGTAAALTILASGYVIRAEAAEVLPVAELSRHTHVHGLAVDRGAPSHLLIATHHGLFRAGPDGKAERISEVQDFMGFNAHPTDADVLYASGHPARGGNLGFIVSVDRGKSWKQMSPGVGGPVDFHQMTVSPADPKTIYGSYGGLQITRDGGKTWKIVGPTPDKLIDLAASTTSPDALYAATEEGLFISINAGKSWKPVFAGAPVTLVEVTPNSTLYAFVVGRGLVRSTEGSAQFTTLSNDFGGGILVHLTMDPNDPSRLFAATGKGRVLASTDQGRTWDAFGGSNTSANAR
jgi:photosystem II stability/assembly factor-like uncharacterized protein